MSSQKTVVLNTLQDLAEKDVEAAVERLGEANRQLVEVEKSLAILMQYRADYASQRDNAMANGITAEVYQNYQNFLGKLSQAIVTQTESVERVRQICHLRKQEWQECQKKKMSYDVLLERAEKRVQLAELKKDQKMMDEYAMRASRNNTRQ
ncbi:flagellar export protein FliJ [Methylobacillus gramineus]|uniref:flagellar export protein FliJ n=1 Tax=Methylobacillus gramineus TaxID=755169 RepID=UPI001CFF8414|nr:flagellar export protein FliJ [Methylobacillus gramineus]MCB5183766.1 flagellar export protein FliJ [Methylobacillus gramineus]